MIIKHDGMDGIKIKLKRYCSVWAAAGIVYRFFYHLNSKRLSKKIYKLDHHVFHLQRGNRAVYYGDVSLDCERIRKGEKKILFYMGKDKNKQFDIKHRWEQSRHHDLYVLSLDRSSKSRMFFLSELQDRISSYSFQDTNSMEVAISAINVICACQSAGFAGKLQEELVVRWIKKCLIYILNNLEDGYCYSTNHYFFDLIGISWILGNIVGNKFTRDLEKSVRNKLKRLMKTFLLDDGSLYENSTHYHKYVTESFLEYLAFNPLFMDKDMKELAEKMVSFCLKISDENKIFGYGDNDSGRLLPLPCYYSYDSRNIEVIKKLADRLDLKEYQSLSEKTSFGVHILCSQDWKVAIRCDELKARKKNKLIGSHAHNDQLEILANYKGIPLIVDFGTYLYIPSNYIRKNNLSVLNHNTLIIEDEEQNRIFNDWNYYPRSSKGKIYEHSADSIVCSHDGYKNFIHVRTVSVGDGITVKDKLFPKNPDYKLLKNTYVLYIVSPDFVVKEAGKNKAEIHNEKLDFVFCTDGFLSLINMEIHPEYGLSVKTKAIKVQFSNPLTSECNIKRKINWKKTDLFTNP